MILILILACGYTSGGLYLFSTGVRQIILLERLLFLCLLLWRTWLLDTKYIVYRPDRLRALYLSLYKPLATTLLLCFLIQDWWHPNTFSQSVILSHFCLELVLKLPFAVCLFGIPDILALPLAWRGLQRTIKICCSQVDDLRLLLDETSCLWAILTPWDGLLQLVGVLEYTNRQFFHHSL